MLCRVRFSWVVADCGVSRIKRFAPGLTAVKVHGTMAERDRILSMPDVLAGTFDVYLTTYDMILSEEVRRLTPLRARHCVLSEA